MSSNGPSKEAAADEMKAKEDAEKLQKFEELLSKIESTFTTIMDGVLKKFSRHVAGPLKVILECSICKELIIQAMTRRCRHTFCNHCMMEWFKKSTDCPVCRNGVSIAFDNPSIDKVINFLVEASFTQEEKEERDQRIQQRSAATIAHKDDDDGLSAAVTILRAVSDYELTRREKVLVVVGRAKCIIIAQELLQEIFTTTDLQNETPDEESSQAILDLLVSFINDFKSLDSALNVFMEDY